MRNFGNNLEEFIKDFKERVVSHASWNYPKEYLKSEDYYEKDLDKKFEQALNSDYGKQAVLEVIEVYYSELKEYEEILGY